uniref:Uncharacterized protein n=1 Tax=Arundo donax TaxID=35708 RepID=A0A0A9BB72_ARUDO
MAAVTEAKGAGTRCTLRGAQR